MILIIFTLYKNLFKLYQILANQDYTLLKLLLKYNSLKYVKIFS
jgi:hypothetical protein